MVHNERSSLVINNKFVGVVLGIFAFLVLASPVMATTSSIGSGALVYGITTIYRQATSATNDQVQSLGETYVSGGIHTYDISVQVSAKANGLFGATCSTPTSSRSNVASGVKIGVSCVVNAARFTETVTAKSTHTAKDRATGISVKFTSTGTK